jgi:hypothetical protein
MTSGPQTIKTSNHDQWTPKLKKRLIMTSGPPDLETISFVDLKETWVEKKWLIMTRGPRNRYTVYPFDELKIINLMSLASIMTYLCCLMKSSAQ